MIVVGGGPVGMTAATACAQAGLEVVVLEQSPVVATDWRASTFHPPTLELLDELGVAGQMHAEGLAVPVYQFRDRQDGLVAEFDFSVLADETSFPYRLQLNQQHLVRMLGQRLRTALAAQVRFGMRVIGIEQDGATVTVIATDGTSYERITGSHVIGADGAHSTVRQVLGVDFEGFTYPERFLIASISADMRQLLPGIADVNYISDPDEWLFVLRTPESWRIVYPVSAERTTDEALHPDVIQAHLQGVAPNPAGYSIVDQQLYNVHQRIAGQFRAGKVVLVGDAAHVNSPLGGVGLNSGIHDAVDVARRIARIRTESADTGSELDEFASVRRQIAIEYVQTDTERNTERLFERDPERRTANHAELRAVADDPDKARAWCRRASLLESVRRFGIGTPPTGSGGVSQPAQLAGPAIGTST